MRVSRKPQRSTRTLPIRVAHRGSIGYNVRPETEACTDQIERFLLRCAVSCANMVAGSLLREILLLIAGSFLCQSAFSAMYFTPWQRGARDQTPDPARALIGTPGLLQHKR